MLIAESPESRIVGALALRSMSVQQLSTCLDLSADTVRTVGKRLLANGAVQWILPFNPNKAYAHRTPQHLALTPSAVVPFDFYREPKA